MSCPDTAPFRLRRIDLSLEFATKVPDYRRVEVVMSRRITLSGSERRSLAWYKAQSSTNNGQCVEIASTADIIAIRDSKDPDGPILVYTSAEFSAFLQGARNGEFDALVH
jgi:hypothetical protein